jgi:arabinogalactan endo-1,4-beta-galactosidase
MEISILKDNGVKYTRYYIFDKPKDFRIPNDYPLFFEGDEENKRPLDQAKRILKRDGCEVLKVYNNGKWFEYVL